MDLSYILRPSGNSRMVETRRFQHCVGVGTFLDPDSVRKRDTDLSSILLKVLHQINYATPNCNTIWAATEQTVRLLPTRRKSTARIAPDYRLL